MLPHFYDSILQLIVQTATDLPPDVRTAISGAMTAEPTDTRSGQALNIIATNIDQAAENEGAICQDTGMPTFEVRVPVGVNQIELRQQIKDAIVEATRLGKLRPNSVDSITGKNSGNNLGPGTPIVHFEQWESPNIEVRLLLKGGGCENTNAQYALPCDLSHLGQTDRTLEGVRKCILHAVWHAQGKGCSPGAVGVCVGGDRTSGYLHAKEQLFRKLDDTNPDTRLADLEQSIMTTVNHLGIGTMGFSGNVSLIGCKIGALNRLPASFFVSVAYDCWAFRRLGLILDGETGVIREWMYRDPAQPTVPMVADGLRSSILTGRETVLHPPLDDATIRGLHVGEVVLITGRMYTGRDQVHAYLMEHDPPVNLQGSALYHCGPVVVRDGDRWKITAAGPTTSIREEPYQGEILRRYGVKAVIGKGGMGDKTLAALKETGAVYLNAIGGAAQFYARTIEQVDGVSLLDFGTPEAMWHLQVREFPAIVTMDAHGASLHHEIEVASGHQLAGLGS